MAIPLAIYENAENNNKVVTVPKNPSITSHFNCDLEGKSGTCMSKAGMIVIGMHNKDEKKVNVMGLLPPSYANNAKYALNPYNVADKIALVVPNIFSFALIYLLPPFLYSLVSIYI